MKKEKKTLKPVFMDKSVALSEAMRRKLMNKIINDLKAKPLKNINKKLMLFCDEIYEKFVTPYTSLIDQLPENWVETCDTLTFGTGFYLNWQAQTDLDFKTSKPQKYIKKLSHIPYLDSNEYATIYDKLKIILSEYDTLVKNIRQTEKELQSVLSQFKTTKQLFLDWPEMYCKYREVIKPTNPFHLPTIPLDKLNKKLGL